VDGSNRRGVTPTPEIRSFHGVTLSSDGKRIAYVARGEGICVADLDTGKGRKIADTPGVEYFPHWSADDQTILFTSGSDFIGPDEPVSRIFLVEVSSGSVKPLTDGTHHCRDGMWSPDGKQILLQSTRPKE
jgi:Tol biopolymer transport system component